MQLPYPYPSPSRSPVALTLTLTKVEQLSSWLAAQCGFDAATAAKYAATPPEPVPVPLPLPVPVPLPLPLPVPLPLTLPLPLPPPPPLTRYAEVLVAEGVDRPSDLADLEVRGSVMGLG